jgi:uncharacterized protein (TIGR00251 family)
MTSRPAQVWRTGKSGLLVLARVTPKSSRDGIEGVVQTAEGAALKVRVRAVAEEGQANRSVATVIADWLGIPKTHVTLAQGGKSRLKTLSIEGQPDALERLLIERLSTLEHAKA